MAELTHSELVTRAVRWLRRQGCRVILHDPFRTPLAEQPDALGFREGCSILVEAKASRSDFKADESKPWRTDPSLGMGNWRFFIAPAGLLDGLPLPEGWGLIEVDGRATRVVSGGPLGNCGWWKAPFAANLVQERNLLVSALAQPEARPKPPAIPRPGIDVQAWYEAIAAGQEAATNG